MYSRGVKSEHAVAVCRLEPSAAKLRRSEAAPLVTARVQSMQFPSSVLMEPPPVNHRLIANQIRCDCFLQMPAQCLVHMLSTVVIMPPVHWLLTMDRLFL